MGVEACESNHHQFITIIIDTVRRGPEEKEEANWKQILTNRNKRDKTFFWVKNTMSLRDQEPENTLSKKEEEYRSHSWRVVKKQEEVITSSCFLTTLQPWLNHQRLVAQLQKFKLDGWCSWYLDLDDDDADGWTNGWYLDREFLWTQLMSAMLVLVHKTGQGLWLQHFDSSNRFGAIFCYKQLLCWHKLSVLRVRIER